MVRSGLDPQMVHKSAITALIPENQRVPRVLNDCMVAGNIFPPNAGKAVAQPVVFAGANLQGSGAKQNFFITRQAVIGHLDQNGRRRLLLPGMVPPAVQGIIPAGLQRLFQIRQAVPVLQAVRVKEPKKPSPVPVFQMEQKIVFKAKAIPPQTDGPCGVAHRRQPELAKCFLTVD